MMDLFRSRLLLAVAPVALLALLASPLAEGRAAKDEIRFSLKQALLTRINQDRALHDLPPVAFDPHASVIADQYCEQQIKNHTTGHFTTDGLAPYMRYSFAGGNDGLSENAAAWTANYRFTDSTIAELVRRSQDAMMAEVPPHDGHRRAILDPAATHVGIGIAWEDGEFRLTQEFVRRYLGWDRPLPRTATLGERVTMKARAAVGYKVEAISVHYEPPPRPLPAAVANTIDSYNFPPERRDYLPRLAAVLERSSRGALLARYPEYSDGRKGDFTVESDGSFAFAVPFADGPGVYTVVVWLRRGTEPPVAASNVSIRVEAAQGGGRTPVLAR